MKTIPIPEFIKALDTAPEPRVEGERFKLYFTKNQPVSQSNHAVWLVAVKGWAIGALRWEVEL